MRKVPYSPPKCTICGGMATMLAKNREPRCARHLMEKPLTKVCPKCKSLMVVRENKSNHSYFWGCSNFPRCGESAPIR